MFEKIFSPRLRVFLFCGLGLFLFPGLGQAQPTQYFYVSDNPSRGPYKIIVYDPATDTEVTTIPTSVPPLELAPSPDGSRVYVMLKDGLGVINTSTNTIVANIPGVGGTIADFNHVVVSPDGSRVYIVSSSSNPYRLEVSVVDTAALTRLGVISDANMANCHSPYGASISSDGTTLFSACRDSRTGFPDRFLMVDLGTGASVSTASFSRAESNNRFINAMGTSLDGSRVYLSRAISGASDVLVFDAATGAIVQSIPNPDDNALPRAVGFGPDGTLLYLVDQREGMKVYDLTVDPPVLIPTALTDMTRGFDIGISPDGTRAYVPLAIFISVIDLATLTEAGRIWNGSLVSGKQITSNYAIPFIAPTEPPSPGDGYCRDGAADIESMVVQYAGGGCAASSNSQNSSSCDPDGGGAAFEEPVRIRVIDPSTKAVYADKSEVFLGDSFSAFASDAGLVAFKGDTRFEIYRSSGEWIEENNVHTSCSQPLEPGDQFGSILVDQLTLIPK